MLSIFRLLLQVSLLASAFAVPVGEEKSQHLVERAGPSGKLLAPVGGYTTVSNGGTIPVTYQRVKAPGLFTSSIDVFLVRKSKNYNHTLATYLTNSASKADVFGAEFKIPTDLPDWPFANDYQVQVWERQMDPGDTSQRVIHLFPAAAPFITITYAG